MTVQQPTMPAQQPTMPAQQPTMPVLPTAYGAAAGALMCAALGGNADIFKALLPVSDPLVVDDDRRSLIHCVATGMCWMLRIIRMLISPERSATVAGGAQVRSQRLIC